MHFRRFCTNFHSLNFNRPTQNYYKDVYIQHAIHILSSTTHGRNCKWNTESEVSLIQHNNIVPMLHGYVGTATLLHSPPDLRPVISEHCIAS